MCPGQCGPVQAGAGGHVPVGRVHLLCILLPRARHRFDRDTASPGSIVRVQLGCQGVLSAPVFDGGRPCRRGSSSRLQWAVAGHRRSSGKRVDSDYAESRGGRAFGQRVQIRCLIPNGFRSGLRSRWLQAHASWSCCKTVNRQSCSTLAASSLPWKTVARMREPPWREVRVLSTLSAALHTACDLTFATANAPHLRACVSAPMKSSWRTGNFGYARQNWCVGQRVRARNAVLPCVAVRLEAAVVGDPVLLRQRAIVIKGQVRGVQGKAGSSARPDDSLIAKDTLTSTG